MNGTNPNVAHDEEGTGGEGMDRYLYVISIIVLILGAVMMLLGVWMVSSGFCLTS